MEKGGSRSEELIYASPLYITSNTQLADYYLRNNETSTCSCIQTHIKTYPHTQTNTCMHTHAY